MSTSTGTCSLVRNSQRASPERSGLRLVLRPGVTSWTSTQWLFEVVAVPDTPTRILGVSGGLQAPHRRRGPWHPRAYDSATTGPSPWRPSPSWRPQSSWRSCRRSDHSSSHGSVRQSWAACSSGDSRAASRDGGWSCPAPSCGPTSMVAGSSSPASSSCSQSLVSSTRALATRPDAAPRSLPWPQRRAERSRPPGSPA